ncbi:sensor domain-containing diguanylate cyclase [Brevibacillus dissolubilis]|uniref:sensor domain-containing diguanylate cyclase n=1 Tax=Brevibacillus dissolubilis TaxID=1844116 RepID=UPI00210064E2|nr:sensor domain-containing diguanylate cyclase [Brevibacillus dissolubilis]
MAIQSQMLGKLETVFKYMIPFFLHSWPKNCPGTLFLTDSLGQILTCIPLLAEDNKTDPVLQAWQESDLNLHSVVFEAIQTGEIAYLEDDGHSLPVSWAVVPLKERDGRLRATIGLAAPKQALEVDLLAYIRAMEPLILMGYDAYIHQAASQIVMNANRYERSIDLIRGVIEQIDEIVEKGYCSAVKLDQRGLMIPQDRITTERKHKESTQLGEILARFAGKPVEPMVTDGNKVVIYPVICEAKPLIALILHIPPDEPYVFDERDVAFLQTVGDKISFSLVRAIQLDDIHRDAKKKDLLYGLTKKIQASIDVNNVLEEIINSIPMLYPYFTVDLYLSVETNTTLPVKSLLFQAGENEYSNQAYIEGRPVVGTQIKDGRLVTVLAAPLLGKQGIYGVLQLTTNELVNLNEQETEYISILAETAGTAFENAQLYQQSRNLIRELRLINEMAQQLNRSLNLDEILSFVTNMLLNQFDAEYCAILRKTEEGNHLEVLCSSNPTDVGRWVPIEEQPITDMVTEKRAVILANPSVETMPFSLVEFASLMGVPLMQGTDVTGVLLVADSRGHFFSFDDFKLLEIVGQHTSLAITNALLHSEVRRMVITDNLTGLYARKFLNDKVHESLGKDSSGSLILIDIDFFKKVNDTYGHQVGDEILIRVSSLIKQSIRESDIAARWGGEEIAIYLPRVDLEKAAEIAERMRRLVESGTEPAVTISSGVAKWDRATQQNMSVEALFQSADVALYDSKRNGRNQVTTYKS